MTVDHLLAGLARSYLFEGLPAEEIEPLARACRARSFVRGEHVFHAGDQADELWVVLSGEVKDCLVEAGGNEVIYFVHGPGMTCGEPAYFAHDHVRIVDMVAVRPTMLIRIDRRELDPFMNDHPVLKERALEALASNMRFQTNMIASLLTRPLADRLALRLLELIDSGSQRATGQAVTPKITQSVLAAMIGVSRENVNRALAALSLDGSIRLEDGRYVLVDVERLRRDLSQGYPLAARRDRRYDL